MADTPPPGSACSTRPVTLQFFSVLLASLATCASPEPTHRSNGRPPVERPDPNAIVRDWLSSWPAGFGTGPVGADTGTGSAFLRLLFPSQDGGRNYGMNRPNLCRVLSEALCLMPDDLVQLMSPVSFDEDENGSTFGCDAIGLRLARILARTSMPRSPGPPDSAVGLSLVEADELLDELASYSQGSTSVAFSGSNGPSYTQSRDLRKARHQAVARLLHGLDPYETGLVVQVLLCRQPEAVFGLGLKKISDLSRIHTDRSRCRSRGRRASTRARGPSFHRTMAAWYPTLPVIFAQCADLRLACNAVEQGLGPDQLSVVNVGVKMEVRQRYSEPA